MLIFFMPCRTASRRMSSGTPEEPCSTSGTGTAARSSRDQGQVEHGVPGRHRVRACPPRRPARRRRCAPRSATASCGLVRAPGACTPSLPPTSPSSASTHTPRSWHQAATSAVAATFSSSGERGRVEHHRADAQPHRLLDQVAVGGVVEVHGHRHRGAAGRPPARRARSGPARRGSATQFSLICSTTGRPSRLGARDDGASACSSWITLNAPTPRGWRRGRCRRSGRGAWRPPSRTRRRRRCVGRCRT